MSKGSKFRPFDKDRFDAEFERIFSKKANKKGDNVGLHELRPPASPEETTKRGTGRDGLQDK